MNEIKIKKPWKLIKNVLPQHTDHAGVMWHGSYLNLLEEARIDALNEVGISYSELSKEGFEIPVVSIQINYRLPFLHGEKIELVSEFKLVNKIKINCETIFLKPNGKIGAEARLNLVIVSNRNQNMKLVRQLPLQIKEMFLLLEEGQKTN